MVGKVSDDKVHVRQAVYEMYAKPYLAQVIYQIHQASSFFALPKVWSSPTCGFSYDHTRSSKFLDDPMKKGLISEQRADVICILGDWETVAEGIILTDRALCVRSPKNRDREFRVAYEVIKRLDYDPDLADPMLTITTDNNSVYHIDTPLWSKRNIHLFLQIATGLVETRK